MINVSDHRHIPDVGFFVHDRTDLVYGEMHLKRRNVHSSSLAVCCAVWISLQPLSIEHVYMSHMSILHLVSDCGA